MILFWFELTVLLTGFAAALLLFWQMPLLPRKNVSPADSISVVIPSRNEAKTLPLLLLDLSAQTMPPCEIIVVNDNSEDETAQIAQSFGVRVITLSEKPDGWVGKCWACQKGAVAAAGESVLFLDADVRLSPDALGRVAAVHAQHGAVSVQPYHATNRIVEDLALFFNLAQVCDLPPFYGPGAMLVNSESRQRLEPRFEGRAAARRGSNAA